MKYRMGTEIVEALQWNGTNLIPMGQFTREDIGAAIPGPMQFTSLSGIRVEAQINDWIIKHSEGKFSKLSPENFHLLCHPFPPHPTLDISDEELIGLKRRIIKKMGHITSPEQFFVSQILNLVQEELRPKM